MRQQSLPCPDFEQGHGFCSGFTEAKQSVVGGRAMWRRNGEPEQREAALYLSNAPVSDPSLAAGNLYMFVGITC